MAHPNQLKIQKAYLERQAKAGVIRVAVLVPADRADEIKLAAARMRDEARKSG